MTLVVKKNTPTELIIQAVNAQGGRGIKFEVEEPEHNKGNPTIYLLDKKGNEIPGAEFYLTGGQAGSAGGMREILIAWLIGLRPSEGG